MSTSDAYVRTLRARRKAEARLRKLPSKYAQEELEFLDALWRLRERLRGSWSLALSSPAYAADANALSMAIECFEKHGAKPLARRRDAFLSAMGLINAR